MNLSALVASAVAAVNPRETIAIQRSTGSTTNPDGSRVPVYIVVKAQAQIQSLQYNDIAQTDFMNIQGVRCAMYLPGDFEGIVRAAQKGGDVITRADGTNWLIAMVLERWIDSTGAGWVKVACTLQDGRATADETVITADNTLISVDMR